MIVKFSEIFFFFFFKTKNQFLASDIHVFEVYSISDKGKLTLSIPIVLCGTTGLHKNCLLVVSYLVTCLGFVQYMWQNSYLPSIIQMWLFYFCHNRSNSRIFQNQHHVCVSNYKFNRNCVPTHVYRYLMVLFDALHPLLTGLRAVVLILPPWLNMDLAVSCWRG